VVGLHTASGSTTHTLVLKEISQLRESLRQCGKILGAFIEGNRVPGASLSNWPRAGSFVNVQAFEADM